MYHLALGIIEVKCLWCILGNENHIETTVLEHACELTLAGTEGYCAGGIIVGDIDGGVFAFIVFVVGALVLVKLEATILTGIDVEVDKLCGLFIAPLHLRTEWDDSTLANEYWYLLVWSINNETLTSLGIFACVKVVPTALSGEVNRAVAGLVIAYRTSHQGWTEHPLVADILDFLITIKVHYQWAHQGVILEVGPTCQ